MATRKRLGKFSVNKQLLTNAIISAIAVQQIPPLVNKYFFASNPLSGMTLTASGAAAGIVLGMLLKKPDIGTLSIAFAGSDILNGLIAPALAPASLPSTMNDFMTVLPNGKLRLNDYTNNVNSVMSASEYSKMYN